MTFPEFLMEGSFQDLEEYKQLMVTSIKLLGQTNETLIEEDMTKVLENEIKLAKLSKSEYSFDIRIHSDYIPTTTGYTGGWWGWITEFGTQILGNVLSFFDSDNEIKENEKITLDEMNKLFPSCNWVDFVNTVMASPDVKVNGSEMVVIPEKERLVKM